MTLKPHVYDKAKFFTQIVLPAIGTLYFTLAGIWGLPSAEEVVGTIIAVDTFLGVILHISSNAYKAGDMDGTINVTDHPDGGKIVTLDVTQNPEVIEQKDQITFKVNK